MKFWNFIDIISSWSGKAVSFLFLVVTGVIVYEVVARYIFNAPTQWVFEATLHLCAIVYTIGGAYTLYVRGHIIIDVVYEKFSPRLKAISDSITSIFFFLFSGVLLWQGIVHAWRSVAISETSGSPWNPPLYPMWITMTLGALLILLQGVAKLFRDLNIAIRRK